MRYKGRKINQLREISVNTNYLNNAEGSCMIKFGKTQLVCSASIDNYIPFFLRGKNQGWVTAEYGMLPRSTDQRMKRESSQGKQSGRTLEIQRLIGRSMRAIIDLKKLGQRQIIIDCDVINADGGTRTAAITGSYIALYLAISKLINEDIITQNPIKSQVAAISCGVSNGEILLDLDYQEDSSASVDANFVFSSDGGIIEIQSTAEEKPFSEEEFNKMLNLARDGCNELFLIQKKALKLIA